MDPTGPDDDLGPDAFGMTQDEYDDMVVEICRKHFQKKLRSGEVVEVAPGLYKRA